MVTTPLRLFGVFSASMLLAACAGNLQIPPPGADNPGNPAAGKTYDTIPKSVLTSGPAAPVPAPLNLSGGHAGHGGMQGMDHGAMSGAKAPSGDGMKGMQGMDHGGHQGMSMDHGGASGEAMQKAPEKKMQPDNMQMNNAPQEMRHDH